MYLDVNELAQHKIRIRKNYEPGMLDFHSRDFRQTETLEVRATAELEDGQIRVAGTLHTRIEVPCARCLEPVAEEVSREFDLLYRPMATIGKNEEVHLNTDDTDVGFYEGNGLFLADVLAEQVNLELPMKIICRSDCRGLCPHCGVNLNSDECRCESQAVNTRMGRSGLERIKQDWFKKQ
ncbi:MAG: YceD family protein [Candidatus Acidiferrales bacterium]